MIRSVRVIRILRGRIRTEAMILLVSRQVTSFGESFVATGANEVALVRVDQLVVPDVNVSVRSSEEKKFKKLIIIYDFKLLVEVVK